MLESADYQMARRGVQVKERCELGLAEKTGIMKIMAEKKIENRNH